MHLVVLTHPFFFWVVCHPSRTFLPKKPEQEPQNRFFPLITTKPCPLTSDPWLHGVLYWLGIGWWCLSLALASFLCMSKIYLLLMRSPWSKGSSTQSIAHPWLLFSDFSFFYGLLPLGAGLYLMVGFAFFQPTLLLLLFPAIPFYYSYCDVIWPNPTGPLWASMAQYDHWFFYYITCGLQCPICFLLGILDSFAFPRLPWPFSQLCIPMGFY